jgi:hypothetical protein
MAQATNSLSQAFFAENSPAILELEAMVDRVGIRNVLYALAKICDGKAEHVASMWQDVSTAQVWNRWAWRLEGLAEGSTLGRWQDCVDPLACD